MTKIAIYFLYIVAFMLALGLIIGSKMITELKQRVELEAQIIENIRLHVSPK